MNRSDANRNGLCKENQSDRPARVLMMNNYIKIIAGVMFSDSSSAFRDQFYRAGCNCG